MTELQSEYLLATAMLLMLGGRALYASAHYGVLTIWEEIIVWLWTDLLIFVRITLFEVVLIENILPPRWRPRWHEAHPDNPMHQKFLKRNAAKHAARKVRL